MRQALRRTARVIVVSTIGFGLVAAGIVMLVTPGPGLLGIAAGLAVLSREYAWAARIRDWLTRRYLGYRDRRRAARVASRASDPVAPATERKSVDAA